MRRQGERAGTAQPREQKAQGNIANVYKHLEGGGKEDRARCFSLVQWAQTGKIPLNSKFYLLKSLLSNGIVCHKRLWTLHPWRYSEDFWTWSWTTGSRRSCLSRGLDQMTFRLLPTSTILFIYFSIMLFFIGTGTVGILKRLPWC